MNRMAGNGRMAMNDITPACCMTKKTISAAAAPTRLPEPAHRTPFLQTSATGTPSLSEITDATSLEQLYLERCSDGPEGNGFT